MTYSTFQNESLEETLSLEELNAINGSGLKNEYAKLHKPKAPKKIKMVKPLTLKDIMDGGGSPGPYLPGPSYINQQMFNSYNQWM